MAGIAAMVLTGILGTAMGLNNTAAFMSSCVAFVAVSMWMDSRISRRRAAQRTAPGPGPGHETAQSDLQLDAERPNHDGHGPG